MGYDGVGPVASADSRRNAAVLAIRAGGMRLVPAMAQTADGPRTGIDIPQGFSNETRKVFFANQWAVEQRPRSPQRNTDTFARREAWSRLGHELGIAPRVITCNKAEQALTTCFVPGSQPAPAKPVLQRACASLKLLQAQTQAPSNIFDPYAIIASHMHGAMASGRLTKKLAEQISAMVVRIQEAVSKRRLPLVPSHNDCTLRNMIDDGRRTWLVDWELGGLNDRFFDPATLVGNDHLSLIQMKEVMQCMVPQATRADWAHLHLLRFVSDVKTGIWCLAIGHRRGDDRIMRCGLGGLKIPVAWLQERNQGQLEQWLKDVQSE